MTERDCYLLQERLAKTVCCRPIDILRQIPCVFLATGNDLCAWKGIYTDLAICTHDSKLSTWGFWQFNMRRFSLINVNFCVGKLSADREFLTHKVCGSESLNGLVRRPPTCALDYWTSSSNYMHRISGNVSLWCATEQWRCFVLRHLSVHLTTNNRRLLCRSQCASSVVRSLRHLRAHNWKREHLQLPYLTWQV